MSARFLLDTNVPSETLRPIPNPSMIAATAIEHDLTVVVTRNVKDFARLGATIFNPWET